MHKPVSFLLSDFQKVTDLVIGHIHGILIVKAGLTDRQVPHHFL